MPSAVILPHVHEPRIALQAVDAIRAGAGNVGRGRVVSVDFDRMLCGKPLFAGIVIVSEQFFLLGVHRYIRHSCRQGALHLCVDVTELRVAVGMIRTFLSLAVALQAEAPAAQKLSSLLMTDRMLLPSQMSGQIPGALAYPSQG